MNSRTAFRRLSERSPFFSEPGLTLRLAALGAIFVSAVVPATHIPRTPVCLFKLLTGWPCPGCGLTHSFCFISHGQLSEAWASNPFGFLFYGAFLVYVGWPWLRARMPGCLPVIQRTRVIICLLPALVIGMWLFDVWRILHHQGY
jgi:hypothetical protein